MNKSFLHTTKMLSGLDEVPVGLGSENLGGGGGGGFAVHTTIQKTIYQK